MTEITIPTNNIYQGVMLFKNITFPLHFGIIKKATFSDEELAILFKWCCVNSVLSEIPHVHVYIAEIDATKEEKLRAVQLELGKYGIYLNSTTNDKEISVGFRGYKIYKDNIGVGYRESVLINKGNNNYEIND